MSERLETLKTILWCVFGFSAVICLITGMFGQISEFWAVIGMGSMFGLAPYWCYEDYQEWKEAKAAKKRLSYSSEDAF